MVWIGQDVIQSKNRLPGYLTRFSSALARFEIRYFPNKKAA